MLSGKVDDHPAEQHAQGKVKSEKKYTCTFILRCAGAVEKTSSLKRQSDFL